MAKKKTGLDALAYLIKLSFRLIGIAFKLLWKILTFPFWIYKKCTENKSVEPSVEQLLVPSIEDAAPIYKRKYLLTKHEWSFYKALKPIADKLGLVVLAKIRMADLVETVADTNSEYYRGFAKVKAKHVDFALCRPENLYVELLIELDDSTHSEGNYRDTFVESVYSAVGYKLLRIRNEIDLESNVKEALGVKIINPESKTAAAPPCAV